MYHEAPGPPQTLRWTNEFFLYLIILSVSWNLTDIYADVDVNAKDANFPWFIL